MSTDDTTCRVSVRNPMRTIYTGIDIGTYHVKVVIAAPPERPDLPLQILGTGTASSKGMRQGYIISSQEVTRSVAEAVARASQAAGVQVRRARIGIGGVGLDEVHSTGDVTLTTSGGIVEERDIERALRESEKKASSKLLNRTIIHTLPLAFRVDGTPVFGRVQGWHGTKLSVDTLIITALSQHHDDLIDAVEAAGIEVHSHEVMASPLAASLVTLTKAQKTAGVVLANIGAETLSIAVFENDMPISVKVLPNGSAEVTNQLALSFKIPLTEAEQLKRGAVTGSTISKTKVDSVINSKLKNIFTLVNSHLKEIGKQKMLPAGIVITGGGSGLTSAAEIARATMQLPSQIGNPSFATRAASVDATWAVAYGLCRWGYAVDNAEDDNTMGGVVKGGLDRVRNWFKMLLP